MKSNKLIIKQQSDFRSHRSIKDNIFFLSQTILESFNRKKNVCGIFLTLPQHLTKFVTKFVIYKLLKLNIPLHFVSWINNFLEDRSFTIKIDNFITITCEIQAGVTSMTFLLTTIKIKTSHYYLRMT